MSDARVRLHLDQLLGEGTGWDCFGGEWASLGDALRFPRSSSRGKPLPFEKRIYLRLTEPKPTTHDVTAELGAVALNELFAHCEVIRRAALRQEPAHGHNLSMASA